MFCIVDLEYPCFDTDLISPPSMTKGKETAVCLHGRVIYHHLSCACHVSHDTGVTGLTINQILGNVV